MQKAAVLTKLNEYPQVQEIEVEPPKENEVQVEQSETGICYRDILTMEGFMPRLVLPIVPGHEISGIIRKIGSKVTKFKVGDRVASLIYVPCGVCEYCRSGRENLCRDKKTFGESIDGAYRKYINIPEISLVKVPENVPTEAATIAACVTGMVVQALDVIGGLKEGQTLLVTGAGGGVGSHAVQIGKALGATVIAETSSDWKSEGIMKTGADFIVEGKDFSKKVKEITKEGVDLVLETVGSPTFMDGFRSLKFGGRVVVIGNVDVNPVSLPLGNLILKGNSIAGSVSSTKKSMEKALKLSSEGKITPVVGKVYSLEEVGEAYRAMKNRKLFGRAFIKF
ncbi:MAG: alcohol dehydrogenase catalytic domain-containing protein [Thermoplasmata archaeon]